MNNNNNNNKFIFFQIFTLILFVVYLFISQLSIFSLIDLRIFDYLFNKFSFYKNTSKPELQKKVVIVNIDEDIILSTGKYPLPRKFYAYLVKEINKQKPDAVGLALLLNAELDTDTGLKDYFGDSVVFGSIINKDNQEITANKQIISCSDQCGMLNASMDIDGLLRKIIPYKMCCENIIKFHFVLKLFQRSYPENVFINNANNDEIAYKDAYGKLNILNKNGFYIDFSERNLQRIEQCSYVEFYNKYLSANHNNTLNNCVVIIGVNVPGISSYWNTNGFNIYNSNDILGAAYLTLQNGSLISDTPKLFTYIYLYICLIILSVMLFKNFTKNFNLKSALNFSFVWIVFLIIPVAAFLIFSIKCNFFTIFSGYIFISGILVIYRYYYYLFYTNSKLKLRLAEIQKLNEIRDESLKEIDSLKGCFLTNDDFVSKLDHELRNPLMPIIGYANFLKQVNEEFKDNEQIANIINGLDIIQINGNKILDILKIIRQISLTEKAQTKIILSKVIVNDFFEKLKKNFMDNYKFDLDYSERQTDIVFFNNEKIESVIIDPKLFEIIFSNFFDNSLKYSDKDKKCKIEVSIAKIAENTKNIIFRYEDFGWE